MIINSILLLFFGAGLYAVLLLLGKKFPQLIAVPDVVINERFHEDSARLRLFLLHIRTFYKDDRYRIPFWNFVAKTVHRMHLLVMRLDNFLVLLMKRIKARGIAHNGVLSTAEQSEGGQSLIHQPIIHHPTKPRIKVN